MTRSARTILPPEALDSTDRAILNALQDGFPITPRPYDDAGAALLRNGVQAPKRRRPLHNKGQRLPGKLRAYLRFYTVY